MSIDTVFDVTVIVATLLTTLVAGFTLAFAIVVMPGLGTLPDAAFLRGFKATDRVIQDNQPLFVLIWIGSAVSLVVAALLGLARLDGTARLLLILAALLFILGTQAPTITINIPMNNRLQSLDIDALDAAQLESERRSFEARWNRWNAIRSVFAVSASTLLILVVRLL